MIVKQVDHAEQLTVKGSNEWTTKKHEIGREPRKKTVLDASRLEGPLNDEPSQALPHVNKLTD